MSFREEFYASYTLHPSHATTADSAVYDRVYARYLSGWLPQDRAAPVLDLGCGDGKLLALLAPAERGGTLPPVGEPPRLASRDAR